MDADQILVGVDIGGTNTVIGVLDDTLTVLGTCRIDTAAFPGAAAPGHPAPFLDRLAGAIRELAAATGDGRRIGRVGLGVPGRVDSECGVVLGASNLGWRNVPLAAEMARRLDRPVAIDNDVRLYLLGEAIAGAGRGYRNIVCLTLGTGMAMSLMLDGRLIRGHNYNAGEIGHDPVEGNEWRCNCGQIGCLETIASATGIARLARAKVREGAATLLARLPEPQRLSSHDVYQACLQGDEVARSVFAFVGATLGKKLLTAICLLDPEIVIVGGGAAAAGPFLLDPLRSFIAGHYFQRERPPKLCAGQLGDEAGVVGAAYFAAVHGRQAEQELLPGKEGFRLPIGPL
ncbi:ROK family protein [Paenibacillus cymbidii]|uniref:ROK family protein n=1 Tax=Paenibacillus cymbidii TaxID=1639034 RepID=UPI00108187FB|nr:ROK family protein [Paenibacillus cymbidii]